MSAEAKKILIALSIDDKLTDALHHWGERFDWSNIKEVHFLHIVKKNITPLEFGLMETPDTETFQDMKPTLEKYLQDESLKIIPSDITPTIYFHVSRDFYPDEEAVHLLKNIAADLVVVAPSPTHSIFHRSFTSHLIKSSPCDVYVVRPDEEADSLAA